MAERIIPAVDAFLLESVSYKLKATVLSGIIQAEMPVERLEKATLSTKRAPFAVKLRNGTASMDDLKQYAGLTKKITNLGKQISDNVKDDVSLRRQMRVGATSAINEAQATVVGLHGMPEMATELQPSRDTKLKISNTMDRLESLKAKLAVEVANQPPQAVAKPIPKQGR